MVNTSQKTLSGYAYALAGFFIWGVFPIYWNLDKAVPTDHILAYRVFFCALTLGAYHFVFGKQRFIFEIFADKSKTLKILLTTILLGINWYFFLYTVTSGYILQASLGYFLTPLLNVFFGFAFLKENLGKSQIFAIVCGAVAVILLMINAKAFPIYSIILAVSFSIYGLIRKTIEVTPAAGLAVESAYLSIIAIVFVVLSQIQGEDFYFSSGPFSTTLFLIGGGILTAIPMLCFIKSAKILDFAIIGILHYVAPTLQYIIAIFWFEEPISPTFLYACIIIWIGLTVFSGTSFWQWRNSKSLP